MDPLDCMPGSPFRPVDWRWRWAAALRAGVARPRRGRDDAWVRRAHRFQEALARRGGDDRHPRQARVDPPVLAAHRLRHDTGELRWEVQARLLAGQDAGAIAARVGLASAVVEAFAALFHDVAGAGEAADWVALAVLGPDLQGRLVAGEAGLLGRVLAYAGWPLVLDAYLGASAETTGAIGVENAARFRLAAVALAAPVTAASAPTLLRAHNLQVGLDLAFAAGAAGAVFPPLRVQLDPGSTPMPDVLSNPPIAAGRTVIRGESSHAAEVDDLPGVVATPIAVPAPDLDRWLGTRRSA